MPATALAGIALAGWAFLIAVVADMGHPLARLMMPATPGWTPAVAAAVLAMWAVMMAAMMLPSAMPMVLIFARLSRRGAGWMPTAAFVAAYLLVWSAFSVLAAAVHPELRSVALSAASKRVAVFDAASGERRYAVEGHDDWVLGVAFSTDGKHLAS